MAEHRRATSGVNFTGAPTSPPPLRDPLRALAYYTAAARSGYKRAQWKLGRLYRFGVEGVRRDVNRALSLYAECVGVKVDQLLVVLQPLPTLALCSFTLGTPTTI